MNKTFGGGISLHALINDAPTASIIDLLAACRPDLAPFPRDPVGDEPAARAGLLEALNTLTAKDARKLDDLAGRILGLARGRGAQTLEKVAKSEMSEPEIATFRRQPDELGRSIWTYLHAPRTFEDAESLLHATHFREYPPVFASFDAPVDHEFTWSEDTEDRLAHRLVEQLDVEPPVRLSHLTIEESGTTHVVIVRHGGAPTSVAEHRADGAKDWHYYCPSNEVTLIYTPSRGVVEVCADSPSFRQDVAACFAEIGLGQDLSNKPLNFRLYDLSRFRDTLALPHFEPDGFKVEGASGVEVETRP